MSIDMFGISSKFSIATMITTNNNYNYDNNYAFSGMFNRYP